MKIITTVILAATLFTGCRSTKGDVSIDTLTANTWQLETLNEKTAGAENFANGVPTITFTTDNKVGGKGGCNSYSGSFNLNEENGINISQVLSTKMFCEGVDENAYFTALQEADLAKIDTEKLVLYSKDKIILVFVPAKAE